MLKKLRLLWKLWRYMGTSWLLFRVTYALRMRIGLLVRRMPMYRWEDRPLAYWLRDDVPTQPEAYVAWRQKHGGRFFFDETFTLPHKPEWQPDRTIAEADSILAGKWRYFSHNVYEVDFPPNWHHNPMTGQLLPADRHWSRIDDFANGDIKLVWEASRFSVVYILVRAYKLSGDERYAEGFWTLVEDWASHNPPNRGPNWKCGQEASLRVMAWCFGLYGFAGSPHSTPERIATIASMLAVHAERIERNIEYAISTRGNHSISEATGILTISLLFPEFKRTNRWKKLGQKVLENEFEKQFYDDGSYSMAAFNYQRMCLHCGIWALVLTNRNAVELSSKLTAQLAKSLEFLYQLTDLISGKTPNYGSNDGGLVVHLCNCDFSDFRPLIQLGFSLLKDVRPFVPGAWDEETAWICGDKITTPHKKHEKKEIATTGGYYTLVGSNSWLMTRAAIYKDRPTQSDQFHVDLWWKGQNITCDPGTYSYNAANPWNNALWSASVHNTVTVDSQDPMVKSGHFTLIEWPQGKLKTKQTLANKRCVYWEAQHSGYNRLSSPILHRRAILKIDNDRWLIFDDLTSAETHDYSLHWLISDFNYNWNKSQRQITLNTPVGGYSMAFGCNMPIIFSIIRADKDSTRGWGSRYYASKHPRISIKATCNTDNVRFWTYFCPDTSKVTQRHEELIIASKSDVLVISTNPPHSHLILKEFELDGAKYSITEI